MMTGIGVQHRSEGVFTLARNDRSRWAGIRSAIRSHLTPVDATRRDVTIIGHRRSSMSMWSHALQTAITIICDGVANFERDRAGASALPGQSAQFFIGHRHHYR